MRISTWTEWRARLYCIARGNYYYTLLHLPMSLLDIYLAAMAVALIGLVVYKLKG